MANDLQFGIRLVYDGKTIDAGVPPNREQFVRLAAAAKQAGEAAGGAAGSIRDRLKESEAQAGGVSTALRRLGHYAVVGVAVDKMIEFGRTMIAARLEAEKLQKTYAFAFGGVSAGAKNLDYVREAASRLGTDLNSSATAYGKLAAASVGTALEGQKTRSIFEAVSKASTVMGLSAEESNGALLAISQMMSKGTVQAEELRGQLGERIPGAFQIAARAMGVTTSELGKMLEQGQVVASDFLPKFAAELERTLGDSAARAADSLQASINRMSGAWEKFKQSLSGAAGTGDSTLAGAAGWLTTTLEDAAGQMDRVARTGHGLIARMFIGLTVGEARMLGALLGMDMGTGAGIQRGDDWMTAQLTKIARLKAKLAAMPSERIYDRDSLGTEIRIEQARYDQAVARRSASGIDLPTKAELAAEVRKTQSGIQDLQRETYDAWLKDYAAVSPVVAARQAVKDYKKKFEPLKTENTEAYKLGLAPHERKLSEALIAEGRPAAAITDAKLDAEQSRLKAWHEEYRDTVKRTLEESAVDYQGYWALVGAGERHLVAEQIRLLEARKKAAIARGDKADPIRLQGELDALRQRLGTGIDAETGRGLAGDLGRAEAVGKNAASDQRLADAKALSAAAAWRRENLSLLEQELVAAREKAAQDLAERQAGLAKNAALEHSPDLLKKFQAAAAEQSAQTVAGIEAEIRARHEANDAWETGATRAVRKYLEEVQNAAKQSERFVGAMLQSTESAWVKWATTGKFEIKDVFATLAQEVARSVYAKKVAPTVTQGVEGLSGWLGKALGFSGGGGVASSEAYAANDWLASAKGNVFAAPSLHRYVNTVQSSPTYFGYDTVQGFSRGGVFAEAGSEAVMPLAKDAQGRLGVRAQGGGAAPPNVAINVINQSGGALTARSQGRPQFDGERWVQNVILTAYNNDPSFRAGMGG